MFIETGPEIDDFDVDFATVLLLLSQLTIPWRKKTSMPKTHRHKSPKLNRPRELRGNVS